MKQHSVHRLPAFEVVPSVLDYEYLASDFLGAYADWPNRLFHSSRSHKTPILYHRGSWLASQGYDPADTDPLLPFPFVGDTATPIYPTPRQFKPSSIALAYGERGALVRAPTSIMYNGKLKVDATGSNIEFDYMDALLMGMSDELNKKGVFAASMYNDAGNTGLYVLTQWIPGTNLITPKTIDENTFDGGNLLILNGVRFHTVIAGPSLTPVQIFGPTQAIHFGPAPATFNVTAYIRQSCTVEFDIESVAEDYIVPDTDPLHPGETIPHIDNSAFYVEQGGRPSQPPYVLQMGFPVGTPDPIPFDAWRVWAFAYTGTIGTVTNEIRTDRVAHDIEVLERVIPRFRNVRHILYARNDVASGSPVNAECAAMWQSIGFQLRDLNTILRGPYEMDVDLASIIIQDITDWLATL